MRQARELHNSTAQEKTTKHRVLFYMQNSTCVEKLKLNTSSQRLTMVVAAVLYPVGMCLILLLRYIGLNKKV